ncbi:MAG TPA: hypothetical protein VGN59_12135 [Acidimicrobiia bacterium]|jgi:hypothetical protein
MSDPTGPTLDEEGIPDLEGPLSEKELTGDAQEGVMPPGNRAHVESDWGITTDEQSRSEPLDIRTAHERPDIGETDPVDEVARDLGLDAASRESDDPADQIGRDGSDLPPGEELVGDDLLDDEEDEEIAEAVATDPLEGRSAEEAALHVVDDDEL